jgi:DNA-binding transcriptional MocR family regulator
MSYERRKQLILLARKHNALVICDDVYDFLQWPTSGEPSRGVLPPESRIPRLCDIDMSLGPSKNDPGKFGYAISNGSFSKIVAPGVRTGWVEGTPAFAHGLAQTGSTMSGGAPSQLCAAIVSELLRSGDLVCHLESVTLPALQRRHRLMLEAVAKFIQPFGITVQGDSLASSGIYGGYFLWLTLPRNLPAREVAAKAKLEENLIIGSGEMFEVHGDEDSARFADNIRLCFSWEPEDDLVDAIERLGKVMGRMLNGGYNTSSEPRSVEKVDYNAY